MLRQVINCQAVKLGKLRALFNIFVGRGTGQQQQDFIRKASPIPGRKNGTAAEKKTRSSANIAPQNRRPGDRPAIKNHR